MSLIAMHCFHTGEPPRVINVDAISAMSKEELTNLWKEYVHSLVLAMSETPEVGGERFVLRNCISCILT
jgi:hypothetical protein